MIEEGTTPERPELEGMRMALAFLASSVMERKDGARISANFVACRVVVIRKLLGGDPRSLREYARELKVSPASLSKIGLEFSAQLGMRAAWQRITSRDTYRRRAVGVHSGTWTPSAEWERRKVKAHQTVQTTPTKLTPFPPAPEAESEIMDGASGHRALGGA